MCTSSLLAFVLAKPIIFLLERQAVSCIYVLPTDLTKTTECLTLLPFAHPSPALSLSLSYKHSTAIDAAEVGPMEDLPIYTNLHSSARVSTSAPPAEGDFIYSPTTKTTYRIGPRIAGDQGQQACGIFEVVKVGAGGDAKRQQQLQEGEKGGKEREKKGENGQQRQKQGEGEEGEKGIKQQEKPQKWALKVFLPRQHGSFKQERERFEHMEKMKETGKGTFPYIIQAKEIFEDAATGVGCIVMPLAKESLKMRM
jgi:hypothetical protein